MSKRRLKFRDEVKRRAQELLLKGHNSKFVLNKLAKEFEEDFEHEDPQCEKTVSRWKNEALITIKKQKYAKEDVPLAKRKHFDELAHTAKLLFQPSENVGLSVESNEYLYIFPNKKGLFDIEGVSREELGEALRFHFLMICATGEISWIQYGQFLSHLVVEYPALGPEYTADVYDKIEEDPYPIIDILRLLVQQPIFNGTCEICESRYQE